MGLVQPSPGEEAPGPLKGSLHVSVSKASWEDALVGDLERKPGGPGMGPGGGPHCTLRAHNMWPTRVGLGAWGSRSEPLWGTWEGDGEACSSGVPLLSAHPR